MANATQMAGTVATVHRAEGRNRILGYLIVCVLPPLFWTALFAVLSWTFGYEVSSSTLLACALAICGFLAVVFSTLAVSPRA
jgi:uncharacterized membrane protein YadS